MISKLVVGLCTAAALGVAAFSFAAGADAIEGAQTREGTVTQMNLIAKTVTVGEQTYEVIGTMPNLRVGERVTVTYLGPDGKPAAWFKSIDFAS